MKNLWNVLNCVIGGLRKEEGQGMVEYGLIIALIAVVVIAAVALIGTNLKGIFNHTANTLTPPTGMTTSSTSNGLTI